MDVKQILSEFKTLQAEKANWNTMFQIVGEYISQIKQNFETQQQAGDFLVGDIFDSTGTFAAQASASALLGYLWPGTARQAIEIAEPEDLELDSETAAFYERMTDRLVAAMDDPDANLAMSLDEYMLDQIIFGTSGVGVEHGDTSKLLFKAYGVKEAYLGEGKNGRIDKCYLLFEWPVERVVAEYGIENVSEKIRKKFEDGKYREMVKVLICIRPRVVKTAKKGKLAMPYLSLHLEYESKKVLKEDGFNEMPISFGRFRRLINEQYGRSPAMNALPDIREANVLREAIIVATEKNLDPPLGVLDDGMLGGSTINTSAGAINVFNASGNISGQNPVFPLVTVGSIPDALKRLEDLRQSISQHFFIDRLLDFNNEQQMTLGEAQIRDSIRASSMAALFARQYSEVFTQFIARAVNILWRMGEFGVIKGTEEEAAVIAEGKEPEYIPDVIAQRLAEGKDIYHIVYKTRAYNASRAAQFQSIVELMTIAGQAAAIDPKVVMRINFDEAIKELADIRGIPVQIIRQDDEVEAMNQQQQQQNQMAQMVEAAPKVAGAVKDLQGAEGR